MQLFKSYHFFRSSRFFYGVIFIWLLVNLFQAAFTGLMNDEAYYWIYAQHPAWGYYDHPPMIAVLIRLGNLLFPGYLGVRFFIVLLSVGILILLKKLINPKDYLLFFVFLFSVFIFQSVGFLAVPDTAFIFFVTLFFFAYRRYLKTDNFQNGWLLFIAITGMFYSKYFGFLVVLLTVLSNLNLVKRKSFWMLFFAVVLAMIPHLIWQINHDFVTFYFHLKERNVNSGFSLATVFEFLGGQLLLLNPLIAFFIVKYYLKGKVCGTFDKSLVFNVVGIFGFAFVLSFFKRVEANWTVAAMVPLLIMAYPELEKSNFNRKSFYFLGTVSIFLLALLRLNLAFDFFDAKGPMILRQFSGWERSAGKIEDLAQNNPVVFSCSYQNASQYIFHTGKTAFTFDHLFYRKNQFDLMNIEPGLQGQEVIFIKDTKYLDDHYEQPFEIPQPDSVELFGKWWYYKSVKHYYSYDFLQIDLGLKEHRLKAGTDLVIPVDLINPLDTAITISPGVDSYLTVCFAVKNRPYQYTPVEKITGLKLDKKYHADLKVKVPEKPGKYFLWVSVQTGWLPPAINHRVFAVSVK